MSVLQKIVSIFSVGDTLDVAACLPAVVYARRSMALLNEDCKAKALAYRPLHQPFERATLVKRHMFRIIVSCWLASSASRDVVSNLPAATNQVSY